jgi:hypothetical protein
MTKDEIEDSIYDIMITDGPDGHIDGIREITEFICALLEDSKKGEKWIDEYRKKNNL